MDRASYFNNTRPTQTQLDFTETSKINAILRRQRATVQLGILRGFRVTPNSIDATLIDIGSGEGFTGGMYRQLSVSGETAAERIQGDTAMITSQGLLDYTNGVKNYVALVYAETSDKPLAEVTFPFNAYDTLFHESFTVEVITEASWQVLTLAQLRLRILVGIITARGAGVNLTSADIQQVVQPKNIPSTTQPVNITGVAVSGLADETLIGSGTLRWEVSTHKLYWTAPGDTEGTGVTVLTSGSYTLTSATTAYWLVVYAVSASLPATDQTDTILVMSLYGQVIPRYSAVDSVHREMLGHGVATVYNPHATHINDLSGGGFDHAGLFHVNGISVGADPNQLSCSVDLNPAVNQILVHNVGGRPNTFLIDGTMYSDITGVASGAYGIVSFDIAPPASGEFMIYLDDAANLQVIAIGTVLWSANIELVDIKNGVVGSGIITWDSTLKTLTYQAQGDSTPGTPVTLMGSGGVSGYYGYYKLYSSNTQNWIIVFVNGVLGGSNSTTFATLKSEVTNADSTILKLCVVNWDLGTQVLSNLRDIRQWGSADWRDKILEEHDENGHHTKVFQNPIRAIAQTGPAISAYAVSGAALELGAPNSAVVGSADTAAGIVGLAAVSAVVGQATSVGGVYGSAPNTAGYFVASTAYGIYASAPNTAGYFVAATGQALLVSAPNNAFGANATGSVAIYASAPNQAIVAMAATNYAILCSAPAIAIEARAANNAINANALNTAGNFVAATNCAVYASAPNTAGYFVAGNVAGYFVANSFAGTALYVVNSIGYALVVSGGIALENISTSPTAGDVAGYIVLGINGAPVKIAYNSY